MNKESEVRGQESGIRSQQEKTDTFSAEQEKTDTFSADP
jgi:hypothetical protein